MSGKVSIIVPLYNREKLILETLSSIVNQKYKNFECIVVDDHSTDQSYAVVNEFIKSYPNIILKLRASSNKGACACRNEGIEAATGDFIMFLDSDDLLSEDCLEQRVQLIEVNSDCDFTVHQIGLFNHNQYIVTDYYSSLKHADDIQAFLNAEGWQTSNTFFKRTFIQKYRFDEDALSWQDVDLHLRILLDKPKYIKFPDSKPDVYMRVSGFERISNSNISYDRIESRLKLLLKLELIFEKKDIQSCRYPFLNYNFKFLEIAALLFESNQFKYLYGIWKESKTFSGNRARFYRIYLNVQHSLKRMHLKIICSILYRFIRLFLPVHLLRASNRQVRMQEKIVIHKPALI